jgi:Tfp pilus assembly protein PilV
MGKRLRDVLIEHVFAADSSANLRGTPPAEHLTRRPMSKWQPTVVFVPQRGHPARARRARAGGFTIIEVAIAGAILMLAIIGTLTMASQSFVVTQNVREFSRANQILQQKMEDIRLLSFTNVQSLSSTFSDPNDVSGFYAGTIAVENYRTAPDGSVASLKVTIKVSWTGRGGKQRSASLVSVFTKSGLNDYIY